jgi:hAT family C-terminal dimerisation region
MKYDYFQSEWNDRPDWITRAREETTKLWKEEYKLSTSSTIHNTSVPAMSRLEEDEPQWRRKKRARLAVDNLDELERFQEKDEVLEAPEALDYWIQKRRSVNSCRLAEMGIAIHSIPGMSAEPERVFSWLVIFYLLLTIDSD